MKRSAEEADKPSSGSRKSLQRADAAEGQAGDTHEPGTASSEPQHARLNAGVATSSNDEQRAAIQEPAAARPAGIDPNPRNFVERLMLVLETNSAPDTIWWIEDGKAVALNIDNLKEGTVLRDHFRGIKYKFFIRNFSRWGFRRNTDFSVPYGQFHYRNILFQRDRPHLVAHMRRDSDVQDIFAEHEAETEEMKSSSAAESRQQTPSSSVVAPASSSETAQEQQVPPAPEDAVTRNTTLLQQLVGLLVEQNAPQHGQLSNLNPDAAQLPPRQQENLAPPTELERAFGHHRQGPDNTTTRGELNNQQNRLLHAIVQLSNQFLRAPANQAVEDDFVLRSVVQAVEAVGQRRLIHEAPPPAAAALVQQLLHNLSGVTTNTHPHQEGGVQVGGVAPQVGPSQNPSRRPDNISESAKRILEALPQQFVQGSVGPQQQQQQQQPQQGQDISPTMMLDDETAARLQEYLMSLTQPAHHQGQDTIAASVGQSNAGQHPNQQVSSSIHPQIPAVDPTFIQELLLTVIQQWSNSHHYQQHLDQARSQVPEQEQQQDEGEH